MEIRVLGPLEVDVDGVSVPLGGPKPRMVVAVLAQAVGRPVSTGTLLTALYGDDPPGGGRRTLATYVSKLRRELGDTLHSTTGGYVLDTDPATIDAVRFGRSYDEAVALLDDDPEAAAAVLREALASWRGHAYADVDAEGPLVAEITRLEQLRLAAIEARVDADLEIGRHDQVLSELEALVAQHPLRERFHRQRMLALYRAGRQADALAAYGSLRTRLVDELGLEPGDELRELERRILSHDPALLLPERRVERRTVVVSDLDPVHWDDVDFRARLRRRDELLVRHRDDVGLRVEEHGHALVVSMTDVGVALDLAASLARETDGLRIAVDHGDVEVVDDAVTGPPVTRAARVLALGHPGQVLITAAAQAELAASSQPGRTLTSLGSHEVSGLGDQVPLYQLEALGLPGPFPSLRSGQLPPPIPVPVPGSLPGHELREQVAASALGTLHLAYQPAVGREVTAFVVDPLVLGHDFVRRFEVEAQRLARFAHPHVAGLLDYWRTPEQAVLIHRHVDGRTLTEVVADAGLADAEVVVVLGQVADALDHAHERGIVHGELGTGAVVLDRRGHTWLRELGIRQVCGAAPGAWLHELAAPEVLEGAPATPRTDVHDLGLLAHHLLSGGPPPPDGALTPLRPGVDEAIRRLTAPDPEGRPSSAGEAAALLADVLGHRPARRVHVVTRNPYRGLEPFTEVDESDFHGRDAVVAELVRATSRHPVVTVVGPSGVGKSSLVRAGLVPAVRRGAIDADATWVVTDLTPGSRPIERLAAALRRIAHRPVDGLEHRLRHGGSRGLADAAAALLPSGSRLLLVVDQLEELFVGTVDEDQRDRVLDLLSGLAEIESPVTAVLTLRADVFDRPLERPRFAAVLRAGLVAVQSPGPEELAEIVRAPAAGVGVEVEPALVARIVADAEGQPGALPLVEHLLTELFDARDPRLGDLRLEDYLDAGGLRGAIGRRAERVVDTLDDDRRRAAHDLFLQLVAVDDDGTVARRRVERPALRGRGSAAAPTEDALERFAAERLLTLDHDPTTRVPTVEVAHEALLREWRRLAGWIEDAHVDLVARHRLETTAAAWAAGGHDESDLLRGSRLLAAEERLGRDDDVLDEDVRALVAASRARADEAEEATRARRRRVTAALSGMLVVALVAAGLAVTRWQQEALTSATARARQLASESLQQLDDDPERGVLLALEAVAIARDQGRDALTAARSALEVATQRVRVGSRLTDVGNHVRSSPRRGRIVTSRGADSFPLEGGPGGDPTAVVVWDDELRPVTTVRMGRPVWTVEWVDDDRLLVGLEPEDDPAAPAAVVYDLVTRTVEPTIPEPWDDHVDAEVSTDGRLVVLTSAGGTSVWDLGGGGLVHAVGEGARGVLDGDRLLVGDGGELTAIDLASGTAQSRVAGPVDTSRGLAVRRDRVLGMADARPFVLDPASGSVTPLPQVAAPTVFGWLDDDRVVIGSNDGAVHVVDVRTGTRVAHPVLEDAVWSVDVAEDGRRVVVTDPTGAFALVDLSTGGPGGIDVGTDPIKLTANASDDGLVVWSRTGPVLVDGTSTQLTTLETGPTTLEVNAVFAVASASGRSHAWVDADGRGHLVRDGEEVPLASGCHNVRGFDPEGRLALVDTGLLCADDSSGPGYVLDVETGARLLELDGWRWVMTGEFGPAGTPAEGLLVVTLDASRGEVHDLGTGRTLLALEGSYGGGMVSPDGSTAILGSRDGWVTVVDVAGLRRDGAVDPERHVVRRKLGDGTANIGLDVAGDRLVGGVGDRTLVVVDLVTGEDVVRLETGPVGDRVAAAVVGEDVWYSDGTVLRRMPMDLDEAIAVAEARLTRGWRPEECERYAIERCPGTAPVEAVTPTADG